jgi:hypothetical protein
MCPVSSFAVYFAEFDNRHCKILRVIRRAGMLLDFDNVPALGGVNEGD